MSDNYFIDTNIFIYSFDKNENLKRNAAKQIIEKALSDGLGVTSYQVVQEFFNVALRKFSVPLSLDDAYVYLDEVLSPLLKVYPDPSLFYLAFETRQGTGFSFYDSLIIASASRYGCKILYTEDLQHGFFWRGVRIIDPFT